MTLHREYHPHPKGDGEIEFSISFNRELTNWATGQSKKVGYQVSVTPTKRTNQENGLVLVEFQAFTGFLDNLLEVNRQSAKRLESAIGILKQRIPKYMEAFK